MPTRVVAAPAATTSPSRRWRAGSASARRRPSAPPAPRASPRRIPGCAMQIQAALRRAGATSRCDIRWRYWMRRTAMNPSGAARSAMRLRPSHRNRSPCHGVMGCLDEDIEGELIDGILEEEEMATFHELVVCRWRALCVWARRRHGYIAGSEAKIVVGARRGRKPYLITVPARQDASLDGHPGTHAAESDGGSNLTAAARCARIASKNRRLCRRRHPLLLVLIRPAHAECWSYSPIRTIGSSAPAAVDESVRPAVPDWF